MGPDFFFGVLVEKGVIGQDRVQRRKSRFVWGRKVMGCLGCMAMQWLRVTQMEMVG